MLPTVPKLHQTVIAPTNPGNPRNGEASMVELLDGRLLLGWTRFTGGGRDHSGAEIWARESADGGFTWQRPYLLQENIGRCNVMSVGFLRLHSGTLLFGFAVKNHPRQDCRYYVRHSRDDGRTWGAPVIIDAQGNGRVFYCAAADTSIRIEGITITGGANGSNTVTFSGSPANLNNALNGLVYAPTTGFSGASKACTQYTLSARRRPWRRLVRNMAPASSHVAITEKSGRSRSTTIIRTATKASAKSNMAKGSRFPSALWETPTRRKLRKVAAYNTIPSSLGRRSSKAASRRL